MSHNWKLQMEETVLDAQEDSQEEDSQFSSNKGIGLAESNSSEITEPKIKRLLGRVKPEGTFAFDVKQQHIGEQCIQESFLQRRHHSDLKIPKYMRFISLDERYLKRCLDLVEFRAPDSLSMVCRPAVPCNIAVNLRSSEMGILFDSLERCKNRRRNKSDLGSFVIQCPSAVGPGQWIVSTIEGNENVRNILKGPLLHDLGPLDSNMNLGRMGSIVKRTNCSNFMSSPALSISSPQKLKTETTSQGNRRHGSESLHKRLFSKSSTNSTCSGQSSSSSSDTGSQGMLHCIWKNGMPYFVFSVDDQGEVYIANLLKVKSADHKDLDYIYIFHSKTGAQKEHGTCDNISDIVGRMKVSSSLTVCSDNSKLRETEFVLFGTDVKSTGDIQSLGLPLRKNKGSAKKVVDMFRTKHILKQKSTAKFGGPSSIPENISWDPCQDMSNKLNSLGRADLIESPPNLELAAIIVKDHQHDNNQEAEVGGWGLKFLEKARTECANTSLEASVSFDNNLESSLRNRSDCSTSINVLVPAGIHGGPRTRNGGPSGLTDRWRSGGHCDCGGWDIGCPLTVLNNRLSQEVSPHVDSQEECKSFDLFMEGSKQGLPTLKMVNIHDGLYFIHFHSALSALQSFSIGMAIIHTQSLTLSPENVQKLKQ